RSEKVAIIGAGPAGLTAAWYLALEGFAVTIFEALPVAGGMLRVGIPDYRLPPETLDYEIDCIKSLGVEIKLNTSFGKDLGLADLEAQGFKAVFMGLGAHQCLTLGVPGEDTPGVQPGVTFLREAALGQAASPGSRVVVVGGGNVAIDSARTALRLGSDEVTIIYRRTRAEMPADEDEIEEALEEGIKIEYLVAPMRFISQGGKLSGVEVQRMELGEPDASGRRRPVPIKGSEYVIPIDGALSSIGQEPDVSCLEEGSCTLEVGRKSCLSADPLTMQTSIPHVFAGGDAVLGPASAVQAIGQGKEAAISITRYLNGENLAEGREKDWVPVEPDVSKVVKRARLRPSHTDPEKRARSWDEVVYALSVDDAKAEASRCLACAGCAECLLCVDACLAGAVDHSDAARELNLKVGAAVLAPGAETFDPGKYGEDLRYGINPDVVTALEFERILSPSGPTMGHLTRPSDQKEPKRIAWLQCVGSRCQNRCSNGYCSSVCCMYAIKQALVAKEHSHEDLECVIFNMDIRTFGKDYEKYFNRAKDEAGVRFIKSRFHTMYDENKGPGVRLEYASEDGEYHLESFDLVVLSVGLQVSPETIELGRRTDIGLNHYNFAETRPFAPVNATRPGVFVSGTFQGPKDIPSSVTEASAAAAGAGAIMSEAKWSQTKIKELPPQMEVEGLEPRVGVFVCKCGINIAGVVDVPGVVEYAAGLPHVVHADDGLFVCSQDVQERMKQVIKEHRLNRVVVASCSPKTHEAIFMDTLGSVGLNKFLFEMANI
ncbi:MAG: FAD-dependent oxidoreductase, partial [Pseudomonadota bacterium]